VPEFDIIKQYFQAATAQRADVVLGIGDDCAILQPPAGKQLAVSTDTLIAGVHFPEDTAAEDVGYKSLAVNLSDLAAMGAEPAWVMLALSLPAEDPAWLQQFMQGFSELARQYPLQLVGGDTTRGALSITVHVTGFVDPQLTLRRDGAKPGDSIYVSGYLGDAGLGLQKRLGQLSSGQGLDHCVSKLNRPQPRIELAQLIKPFATSAIDISDGLLADLGHILEQSQCAAEIVLGQVPLSPELQAYYGDSLDWQSILSAGDDYELCFTVAPGNETQIGSIAAAMDLPLTRIGEIKSGQGLVCLDHEQQPMNLSVAGYNHFE